MDYRDIIKQELKKVSESKFANKTDKQLFAYDSVEFKNGTIDGGKKGGPKAGKIAKEKKLGFHSMNKEDRIKVSKDVGNKIGPRSYKEGFGIFGLSEEEKLAVAKYAAQQSIKSPNHVNNKRLVCPHCGKEGGYTAMKRHHMDRCKHRPI